MVWSVVTELKLGQAVSHEDEYSILIWQRNHMLDYPNELKIYVHKKTITQMFIAALIIIAPYCRQLRGSSSGNRSINFGMST